MQLKFKKKITTSVQFEDHQMEWLEKKANERAMAEQRRVSISEINREVLQEKIDAEKAAQHN